MNPEQKKYYLMSTLKLEESTSTLEIFPGTSSLDNEIQKYVQIRDFELTGIFKSSSIKKGRQRLTLSKALGLGNASKVLSLVFDLLLNL